MLLAAVMLVSTLAVGMTVNAAEITYSDVNEGMWSYGDIKYVSENGLMNGTGGSTFSPAVGVTRGMVVTVLYRAEHSPQTTFKNSFTDVTDDQYYSKAVIWANDKRIVNGTSVNDWGEATFSPDRVITRQELATIFVRYADYKGVITENSATLDKFTDKASVADWASDAMKWATSCGLINGTGTGDTLSPTLTATREQFAAIIHRFRTLEFDYEIKYNVPLVQSMYTELPYPLVNDADVYVAVDGNDSNPGTLDKPLATFEAAKAKVRELKSTAKDEIKVAFKKGDYGMLDISLDANDSGSAECPITYCAYGDGEVYFTNGLFIPKGDFKPLDESDNLSRFNQAELDNIKKLSLSDIPGGDTVTKSSTLFTNGQFCNLARVPNKGGVIDNYYPGFSKFVMREDAPFANYEEVVNKLHSGEIPATEVDSYLYQDKIQAIRVLKQKLDSYSTLEGVQLGGYISKVWAQEVFEIADYDKNTGIVTFTAPTEWGFYARVGEPTSINISNVSEELDFEGEYWIDHNTRTLYVYAPKNDYYIATAGKFIYTNSACHLNFVKLNFRCTTGNPFEIDRSDYVTIDRCNFSYVSGSNGVFPSFSLNLTVKNCTFEYFAGYALAIKGARTGKRDDYDSMTLQSQNVVVENNLFHDISLTDIHSDVAAVKLLDHVIGVKIAHNEFYNCSRHAISFGLDNYDVLIEYNYIHECMVNSADGGAIHNGRGMVGPVNIIRYNLFENIEAKMEGGTMGIYLDDIENDSEIYGNVFYNVSNSILTNGGRDHNIHDNLMINSGTIIINYSTERILEAFANNDSEYVSQYTELLPKEDSPYYAIWKEKCASNYELDFDPANYNKPNSVFAPNNTVVNNVSIGQKFEFREECLAVGTYSNNTVYKNTENPVFINPALGDYGVKAGCGIADNHFAKIGRY